VGIGGIHPPPMPLYPGSEEPLLYPVVHFKSELNRTDDGHWPPWDAKTGMEHWILAADASRPYIWAPEYQLHEGWYNIHVSAKCGIQSAFKHAVGDCSRLLIKAQMYCTYTCVLLPIHMQGVGCTLSCGSVCCTPENTSQHLQCIPLCHLRRVYVPPCMPHQYVTDIGYNLCYNLC
jgi:hypothetical protein